MKKNLENCNLLELYFILCHLKSIALLKTILEKKTLKLYLRGVNIFTYVTLRIIVSFITFEEKNFQILSSRIRLLFVDVTLRNIATFITMEEEKNKSLA